MLTFVLVNFFISFPVTLAKIFLQGDIVSFAKVFSILNKRYSNDNIKSNKNSLFSSSQLPTTYGNVTYVCYGFGFNSKK